LVWEYSGLKALPQKPGSWSTKWLFRGSLHLLALTGIPFPEKAGKKEKNGLFIQGTART
jgi:hypothetical protein